jgi:hypothetical protein
MRAKSYLSSAQLGIINILKKGGWIYCWNNELQPEVEINNTNPSYKMERVIFDIRTFNKLKDKELIIKEHENEFHQYWILNKKEYNRILHHNNKKNERQS